MGSKNETRNIIIISAIVAAATAILGIVRKHKRTDPRLAEIEREVNVIIKEVK